MRLATSTATNRMAMSWRSIIRVTACSSCSLVVVGSTIRKFGLLVLTSPMPARRKPTHVSFFDADQDSGLLINDWCIQMSTSSPIIPISRSDLRFEVVRAILKHHSSKKYKYSLHDYTITINFILAKRPTVTL